MTLYVPLDLKDELPNSPPFLRPSRTPESHLNNVVQAILKAKRIAVVCGAGISVDAGIPDFRSPDGLFQSLRRDNPKESLTSGKDLFDASVFKSAQKTALFYRMIANLASLSSQGQPTAFHKLLRTLDDRGQLLRVYTQNIDALEMKAGLSFGVPEFEEKHLRVKLKGKAKVKAKEAGSDTYSSKSSGRPKKSAIQTMQSQGLPSAIDEDQPVAGPSTKSTRPSSPGIGSLPKPSIIPRCIPLHGTLLTLHCQHCTQSFPLDPPSPPSTRGFSPPPSPGSSKPQSLHSLLSLGTPPPCPSCASLEQTRALVGKRLRGVGKLRPNVVLYGEEHLEGEGVGEAVRRDLCGIGDIKTATSSSDKGESSSPTKIRARPRKGPDLLLVVGTSLRVPGTKRIVREFSKAVRSRMSPSSSHLPTPSPPPQSENPVEIRTIYLNNEFPLPSREWEGIFDTWVNGDVQTVARMVAEVIQESRQKQTEKKQKVTVREGCASQGDNSRENGKRIPEDNSSWTPVTPNKRQKVDVILPRTPVSISKPFRTHHENTRAASSPPITNSKMRRVVLRLPPRPSTPPSYPSAYKRKRPMPEVIIPKSSYMSCSTMEEFQWKASVIEVEYPLKVSL